MPKELPAIVSTPLRVYAGDGGDFYFELSDEDGNPLNLTGVTVRAAWRSARHAANQIDFTIVPTDLAVGQFTLSVTPEVSYEIASCGTADSVRGVWDVQGDNGVDDPETYATGTMIVTKDVTRV